MLTVLIRGKKSEILLEASEVIYHDRPSQDEGVLVTRPDGSKSHFTFGEDDHPRDFFVMNENGNTIARYKR